MNDDKKLKMDKSVAFKGRLLKLFISSSSLGYFKIGNAILDKFLVGKRMKNRFTEHVNIDSGSGSIRACICAREGVFSTIKNGESIEQTEQSAENDCISTAEGGLFRCKHKKEGRPAILWIHGGGYAMGTPEQDFYFVERILSAVDSIVVAPGYTRSMDRKYPKALEECYATLLWLKDNAEKLGADSSKIFVGGDSAGGGLCAALCLYARDRGEVNIAYQMPLYPMIDDRVTRTNQNNNSPCWNSRQNDVAWKLYLGELYRQDDTPYYAAPARATDLSRLPPALTYVGDIEPFYAETVDFMENLKKAGVRADYRVYKGCYHGFDIVCPESKPGKDAIEFFREGLIYAVEKYSAKQNEKAENYFAKQNEN